MIIAGIDCGVHGALAVIDVVDGAAAHLIATADVPTTGTGAKEKIDVLALRAWIEKHHPEFAFIERVQGMPQQGISSAVKYARAAGAIEATIALSASTVLCVEP